MLYLLLAIPFGTLALLLAYPDLKQEARPFPVEWWQVVGLWGYCVVLWPVAMVTFLHLRVREWMDETR